MATTNSQFLTSESQCVCYSKVSLTNAETKNLKFDSIEECHKWKGLEEKTTYTTYIYAYIQRQTSYQPKATDGKT